LPKFGFQDELLILEEGEYGKRFEDFGKPVSEMERER
jgi:hypothetical protein